MQTIQGPGLVTIAPQTAEGETDLFARVIVTMQDGSATVAARITLEDLKVLQDQAWTVARTIEWHRTEWACAAGPGEDDYAPGKLHLARKTDRKLLCGTKEPHEPFSPYTPGLFEQHLCPTCRAAYERAAETAHREGAI